MTEAQLAEEGRKSFEAKAKMKLADDLRAERRAWKQSEIEKFYEEKSGKSLNDLEQASKQKFPKNF